MADGTVAVLESTDPVAKKIDNEELVVGVNTVQRQRVAVPDGADVAVGSTADADTANTAIGLLKKIKALLTGTLAVSGTFWQATQPVSGPVTDAQLRATPVPVSGTVSVTALPAGANNIGDVDVLTLPNVTVGAGDVDHDAVNTLKAVQVAAHASPADVPPALVSASGDRVRNWADRAGAQVVRPRRLRESYTAVCRLAETAARMDPTFTHVANTNKQLVTFHHAATSTREIRIHRVVIYPTLLGTAAGFWNVELRAITGTPATGNPAITPKAHRLDAAATEAVCLVLPTTAGTDATANSPYGSFTIDHGIEATTPPTSHPLTSGITGAMGLVLYDSAEEDDEVLPIVLRAGTLEGVCINSRDTAAMVLRFWAIIKYTEELV